jgi:hypothetical protein
MIRKILGVVIAYAVFVTSSIALFTLSGQNPHGDTTLTFKILTCIYGAIFSFLGGLVLQLVARTKNLKLNYILALIIAGFAAFSLTRTEGNHWTQLLAILIFAPVSILGGLFYLRTHSN